MWRNNTTVLSILSIKHPLHYKPLYHCVFTHSRLLLGYQTSDHFSHWTLKRLWYRRNCWPTAPCWCSLPHTYTYLYIRMYNFYIFFCQLKAENILVYILRLHLLVYIVFQLCNTRSRSTFSSTDPKRFLWNSGWSTHLTINSHWGVHCRNFPLNITLI